MFVLRGSLLMELWCGSFVLHQTSPLPVTPLEAVSLDVHRACAVLRGWLSGDTMYIQIDSIKWIWSSLFSYGETGQTAQQLSACPQVFPGVASQDGYKPGCCLPITRQLWQSCHQLLLRISHNGALLLWSPAQVCVETEGAALVTKLLNISPAPVVGNCNSGSLICFGH